MINEYWFQFDLIDLSVSQDYTLLTQYSIHKFFVFLGKHGQKCYLSLARLKGCHRNPTDRDWSMNVIFGLKRIHCGRLTYSRSQTDMLFGCRPMEVQGSKPHDLCNCPHWYRKERPSASVCRSSSVQKRVESRLCFQMRKEAGEIPQSGPWTYQKLETSRKKEDFQCWI